MKHDLSAVMKGLADLSRLVESRLEDVRSELKAEIHEVKADLGAVKADVHTLKTDVHTLKADVKHLKSGFQKLTTRFDDFLAQDDVSRLERRTTTERLDNHERRLQRLEARPA